VKDDGDDDEGHEEVCTVAAMLFPVKFFFVTHGCIISYSGQDVKGKSENLFMAAHHAVGHVAVGVPLLLTSALFAGRKVAEVPVVLIVLVHACIITSLEELVKLFFEIFPILLVAGRVLFGVIPSREPCFKGTFEEFEELIVVLVHVLHYPYYRPDVNRTVGKNPILSAWE
jgi:hypothetical protein